MENLTTTKKVITTTKNRKVPTTLDEIATTPLQMDLSGEIYAPKVREEYKLSKNQMKIMELLALNDRAFSPSQIFKLCNLIGENTVHRFIKRALKNNWIRQLEVIRGATVNNMFAYYQEPDRLETGQIIKDHRYKYYEVTKLGIEVFEINEKLQ